MYKPALHQPLIFFNGCIFGPMQSSMAERDRQVIWHPYTQMQLAPSPLPIVRGSGAWLQDEAGNQYIDAISSWWVNLHGHAHPYLAEKIYEQALKLEQVIFAGFTHTPAIELAERLLKILPGSFTKLFYSDNGSTAVEVALKMAIQYWSNKSAAHTQTAQGPPATARKKILALTDSYHGDTFGAMSVSERGTFTLAFQDYLFEVEFINLDDRSAWADRSWDEFACIIYEPLVQGAGGMRMHEASALNILLKKCRQHQVICIADEVMTGFGRTGKLFASEYVEEKPDIICLSKGITGGMMALGATACRQEIYDAFLSDDRSKTFFHGHSYTANPLACAAANASLDLLLKDECIRSIQRIVDMHAEFAFGLQQDTSGRIKNVRQAGTIVAFEVETSGKEGYLNNISSVIHAKALERGVLIRPLGNTVYVMPPYCIGDGELKKVYACIKEIIDHGL